MQANGPSPHAVAPHFKLTSAEDVHKEIEALTKLGGVFICADDQSYPALLRTLPDAPPVLAVLGSLDHLQKEAIAIVGARNASLAGQKIARSLAQNVSEQGYGVVSGLARGIDGAAHEGALQTGTVAVLAGGVDHVYPTQHKKLYDAIKEKGVILSEMPLGTGVIPNLFPRRNRIIAGLAKATVVVEATRQSGSMLTADFALTYGREVMAVPGCPLDPRAHGPNALIKQGATLVENGADVLDALGEHAPPPGRIFTADQSKPLEGSLDPLKQKIVEVLSLTVPMAIDEMAHCFPDTPVEQLLHLLGELCLDGLVAERPGNAYVRS
jgi:DNA processing protein